jgi:hypothetical protein
MIDKIVITGSLLGIILMSACSNNADQSQVDAYTDVQDTKPEIALVTEALADMPEPTEAKIEQPMNIASIIKDLSSGERAKIEAAVDVLQKKTDPQEVLFLAGQLRESSDRFVHIMLADILARQRGAAAPALELLINQLIADRRLAREEFARAINWILSDPGIELSDVAKELFTPALPSLAEDLQHADMWVRASSARAIARLAPFLSIEQQSMLVPLLIESTHDVSSFTFFGYFRMRPDTEIHPVQLAAVWALEQFDHSDPRVGAALNSYYLNRLLAEIDPSADGLADFIAAARSGRAAEALRLYNQHKISQLADIAFEDPWLWWMQLPADQLLTNIHTNSNYDGHVKVTRYIGAPGAMDWLLHEAQHPNWGEQSSRMTWTGTLMTARYGGFPKATDPVYLNHWLGIWSDFDSNFRHQVIFAEQYLPVLGYTRPRNDRAAAGVRWPLHAAYRLEARIRGIAAAARHDADVVVGELRDYSLVKLLLGAKDDVAQLTPWLTDPGVWRTGIPGNQLQHSASSVVQAMAAMLEFKAIPEWSKALELYAGELIPYYPDGTEGEQSFHYNALLLEFVRSCAMLFPADRQPPFLDSLLAMGRYRYRFLYSIVRPHDAMTPGEGMMNDRMHPEFQEVFEDPLVAQIINILKTRSGPAPAFDSIVFPWSGYHVLRNGWLKEDTHLYLKGGRKGVGHKSASGNAIQLTAFGRELLTRGGRRSYGIGPFPGHNEYQLSSFGYNTIVVDGKSQRNENAPIQPDPIPARWLNSRLLDFAEGRYDSGYVDIEEAIAHDRQVVFVRDLNLFVVTDRISSEQERSYSQIWKFNKAVGLDQVEVDHDAQILRTMDPNGPNVTLHHFSDSPLEYVSYFAQQHPDVRGWVGCEPHFPAVDVHATWQGSGPQQLVTILRPTQRLDETPPIIESIQEEGVNGFYLQVGDGHTLRYWSATSGPQVMGDDTLKVHADGLLIRDDGLGSLHGLALGVTALQLNGQRMTVPYPSFTFQLQEGQLVFNNAIRIPERFKWIETEAGLVPSYWSSNN